MKQHSWSFKISWWIKAARYKNVYTVWLRLYEFLENVNWVQWNLCFSGTVFRKEWVNLKEHRKIWGLMEINILLLIVMVVKYMCTVVKTLQIYTKLSKCTLILLYLHFTLIRSNWISCNWGSKVQINWINWL